MAKYAGKVGFITATETAPGVWTEVPVERDYVGDVFRIARGLENSGNLNNNITVNNQISIVSDPYADLNYFAMRYIWWMGHRWAITNIEVQRPRLILTIGGVYNAP